MLKGRGETEKKRETQRKQMFKGARVPEETEEKSGWGHWPGTGRGIAFPKDGREGGKLEYMNAYTFSSSRRGI